MPSIDKRIQNVVLPFDQQFDEARGLFFVRGHMPVVDLSALDDQKCSFKQRMQNAMDLVDPRVNDASESSGVLELDRSDRRLLIGSGVTVSFCTYYNSCSVRKWFTYTAAEAIELELRFSGTLSIELEAFEMDAITDTRSFTEREAQLPIVQKTLGTVLLSSDGREPVRLPLPIDRGQLISSTADDGMTMVGFEVTAQDECTFFGGSFIAKVPEDSINDVDLVLASTTFRKEEFIKGNIAMLEREIFPADDDLAHHFHVVVVDNGRTLDAADIVSEHVDLVPNINVGGSGGFARAMVEVLGWSSQPTHILIMDDDVMISPESIRRTFTLLQLLLPAYQGRYISGAMLMLEHRNIQHEDIGYVTEEGYFASKKGTRDLFDIRSFVGNEVHWPDFGDEYAAWWYCCIPMRYVTEETLPLPLFVRGDDVEYSLRNAPGYITLDGICVWHVGFDQKYGATMELYQVVRNGLIIQAAAGICQKSRFIRQAEILFLSQVNQLQYDYADLVLDAVEDFLKGPAVIEKPDGIDIIKEKGKRNEKLVPLASLGYGDLDCSEVYEQGQRSIFERALHLVTYNGHRWFPQNLLDDSMGTTPYDWGVTPQKEMLKTRLLAINPIEGTGTIRTRDEARFKEVYARKKRIFREYRKNHLKVEAEYRDRCPYLRSIGFWKGYLGI